MNAKRRGRNQPPIEARLRHRVRSIEEGHRLNLLRVLAGPSYVAEGRPSPEDSNTVLVW
jgi:hypothetical protein